MKVKLTCFLLIMWFGTKNGYLTDVMTFNLLVDEYMG